MTLPTFNIDIIFEIINELKDDGASLFNFLLLNKQICELTIPILWENPFKLCNIEVESKHYLIIQTYINCLNEDDYKKFISILKRGFKDHKNEIPLLFEYGKYLKEFNIRDLYNAVSTWYEIFKKKNNVMKSESKVIILKNHLFHSIMRQSQKLNCLNWNIGFNDEKLLEIMQHKIKDLDYLTLYCDGKCEIKIAKININFFKNHFQNLSSLKIEKLYDNKFTEDFISLVKSNNNLKEFIFDYGVKKKVNNHVDELITNILELRANSITKLVLNNLDFSNISFDYILKCINLRILVLRSNEGLKFEGIDSFTSFNNLKKLDLTFNDLSSKVTILIIKKAGNNLSSLTIGEEDNKKSINDDTLIALTQYCPNINSLSISGVCKKGFEMIFKYIKNFRLVTLQLYQNKMKGTIMNLEGLLNYIEYEKSLSTLGIGKNDDYWHYYNYGRDNFKDFLDKHNVRLILYKPKFYY
ncbi:hypothetical protein RhiirA5_501880 [Rhizophagus irregularis]|uniref:RNI-like protein n=2 Tax=Rhizophagus irregularis TaxID=588596 RepID=A0A2N0PG28_9GLOM|nr:hypothetical protein RhiirA5_501880 [Rhizophagus irregularis]